MIPSAIAALIFGLLLFFLIVAGIEVSLRSLEKSLTLLELKSARHVFEKIRVERSNSLHRNPAVREHIHKVNAVRYALHLGIVLSVSFVLFSKSLSSNTWVLTVLILFMALTVLDVWWRRLIARG